MAFLMSEQSKAIEQCENEWNKAIKDQNADAAAKFLGDDYVLVGVRSTGTVDVPAHVWLDSLRSMKIHEYAWQLKRVKTYGDSAVVSILGSWRIDFMGKEINENFLLTDVWTRTADGWKVVLRHSSPFAKT